jgi:putative membrane protein
MKRKTSPTPEDRAAVGAAISELEKRTSAEVVAAIASESGRYDRAESLVGFLFAICGLVVARVLAGASSSGDWSETLSAALPWQILAVALGFLSGTVISSHWHGLRRLFASSDEMTDEVLRAARHVFMERQIASTKGRSGILLYVSLFERRVVVLSDARVLESLGQAFCDRLRDSMLTHIRDGRIRDAFCTAIAIAAVDLEADFPASSTDTDELSNTLLIFESRR